MESDGLGLDLALLHIDLVSGEDNWDVLADTDKITVPVGHVLVGDTRGDIEHDDTALAVDVVSIAKTSKLLLAGGVPNIELNLAQVLSCCQLLPSSNLPSYLGIVLTVEKPRGWTSTPSVAMYFFSNSPVKWRLTKVVYRGCLVSRNSSLLPHICSRLMRTAHDRVSSADCPYLSGTTVTNKDELEGWGLSLAFRHVCCVEWM